MLKIEPVAYSIDNSIINNVEFKIANINNCIRVSLINKNEYDVKIKYVKIAETNFSPESEFYGEGYSMLSSYGGTLANPKHIGSYDEETHYKIKNAKDAFTVYNLIKIRENGHIMLMAFSSCNRFVGEFHIKNGLVEVWMHIENYEHTVATAVTNSNLKVLFFFNPTDKGITEKCPQDYLNKYKEFWSEETADFSIDNNIFLAPRSAKVYIQTTKNT